MTQGEGNRDSVNHSRESSFDEEDKTGKDLFFKVMQLVFLTLILRQRAPIRLILR